MYDSCLLAIILSKVNFAFPSALIPLICIFRLS